MRSLRPLATLLLTGAILAAAACASPAFAIEIAHLRNEFSIQHYSRQMHNGSMRLYLDENKESFVDLPTGAIASYSSEPGPLPQASTAAPGPATGAPSTDQIVRQASAEQGVDADFLRSVIRQESAGNAQAVSPAGARGLMQLMPQTASKLGVDDSFSPEQNVEGGARYLRQLLERYHGDAVKALAAYNAGPGAVDRYRGVPPYRETQLYVQRVVRDYNRKKQNAARLKARSGRTAGTADRAALERR
jgi:soluble lytic murein transglycosylase-like protein